MKNFNISAIKKTVIAMLLLMPMGSSHSAIIVTGDLSYNDVTEIITGVNGLTYLGWGVAASLNYEQTKMATDTGGVYEEYHIANQAEAYVFYNDALGNLTPLIDTVGAQSERENVVRVDHRFGNNKYRNSEEDYAWFLSDEKSDWVGYLKSRASTMYIRDSKRSIEASDHYSTLGRSHGRYDVSWLLVSDEVINIEQEVAPVPVPAALWLMGSELLGLVGLSSRKKATVI